MLSSWVVFSCITPVHSWELYKLYVWRRIFNIFVFLFFFFCCCRLDPTLHVIYNVLSSLVLLELFLCYWSAISEIHGFFTMASSNWSAKAQVSKLWFTKYEFHQTVESVFVGCLKNKFILNKVKELFLHVLLCWSVHSDCDLKEGDEKHVKWHL